MECFLQPWTKRWNIRNLIVMLLAVKFCVYDCECQKEVCGTEANVAVDVMWVIDHSTSMDSTEFIVLQQFLKDMIPWFKMSSSLANGARHGCLLYSGQSPMKNPSFETSTNKLQNHLMHLKLSTAGSGSLDEALKYLSRTKIEMDRPSAKNVAVVLTNQLFPHISKTVEAAMSLINSGWDIICVGISGQVNSNQIQWISSSPQVQNQNYFLVSSFYGLTSLKFQEQLAIGICGRNNELKPSKVSKRDTDDCSSNPCENGAECTTLQQGYKCMCTFGYSGVHCENKYDTPVMSPQDLVALAELMGSAKDKEREQKLTLSELFDFAKKLVKLGDKSGGNSSDDSGASSESTSSSVTRIIQIPRVSSSVQSTTSSSTFPQQSTSTSSTSTSSTSTSSTSTSRQSSSSTSTSSPSSSSTSTSGQSSSSTSTSSQLSTSTTTNAPLDGKDTQVNGDENSFDQQCAVNLCLYGGVCSMNGETGETKCDCAQGYSGKVCEMDVDHCLSNPCLNGGICRNFNGPGYMCECPVWFEGKHCETKSEAIAKINLNKNSAIQVRKEAEPAEDSKVIIIGVCASGVLVGFVAFLLTWFVRKEKKRMEVLELEAGIPGRYTSTIRGFESDEEGEKDQEENVEEQVVENVDEKA